MKRYKIMTFKFDTVYSDIECKDMYKTDTEIIAFGVIK